MFKKGCSPHNKGKKQYFPEAGNLPAVARFEQGDFANYVKQSSSGVLYTQTSDGKSADTKVLRPITRVSTMPELKEEKM